MTFETIPVIRGYTEIKRLYLLCEDFNSVIGGGYVRYMCSPRKDPVKANDVDVFPKNEKSFEGLKDYLFNEGFSVKHENNISLTLDSLKDTVWEYSPTIQLIKPVKEGAIVSLGTLEEILENFDFSVVRDWDNRDDEYRLRLIDFFEKSNSEDKWSQEEIDELEFLMRID